MLLDVVTGREPRTFLGEPYEEIAVAGGLMLYLLLKLANNYEQAPWMVTATIPLTVAVVYLARMAVIVSGARSYRLGNVGPRLRTLLRRG